MAQTPTPAKVEPKAAKPKDDFDAKAELLKAFRQIEHIANSLNIRLPG